MIVPKGLFPGARVALLAPSAPVPEDRYPLAVAAVRRLGLVPVALPSCKLQHGHLAGTDHERAADLIQAFTDPRIDGILCMRGGSGAHRLLPLLPEGAISRCPKVFCGYSDITALHIFLGQRCGLQTFHTPMPASNYYQDVGSYTMGYLCRALFGRLTGKLENPREQPMETLMKGCVTAPLCGGNLSVLTQSLGTPWEIDTKEKILFLEDVGEAPYRIDNMLTQLRNAGKLKQCAGFLLGTWTDCKQEEGYPSLSILEIMRELLLPLGKPTLFGLACGHGNPTMSLPMGATLCMDAGRKTMQVMP